MGLSFVWIQTSYCICVLFPSYTVPFILSPRRHWHRNFCLHQLSSQPHVRIRHFHCPSSPQNRSIADSSPGGILIIVGTDRITNTGWALSSQWLVTGRLKSKSNSWYGDIGLLENSRHKVPVNWFLHQYNRIRLEPRYWGCRSNVTMSAIDLLLCGSQKAFARWLTPS